MSDTVPNSSIEAHLRPGLLEQALLEHDAFLRALARGLLGDPDRAEDAVQDAYASALAHPPRIDSEPGSAPHRSATRSWLATVVQNHARNRLRTDSRRLERERRAARAEAQQDDVAERLRVQRRVMNAVESLREPYRTAVFLRFAEGLPPREIAQRTGAPVETVRSRVQRGLEMLRRELDQDFGDRSTWCAALLPFAMPRASAATAAVPIVAWLALVVAIVVIPFGVWTALHDDGKALAALPTIEPWSAVAARGASEIARPSAPRRSAIVDASAVLSLPATSAPDPAARVRVRLIDVRGEPLMGVRIGDSAPSAEDGWIEVAREQRDEPVLDSASGSALRTANRAEFDDGTVELRVDVAAQFALVADDADIAGAEFTLESASGVVASVSRAHLGPRPFVRFAHAPTRTLLERDAGAAWTLSAVTADGMRGASASVHAVRGLAPDAIALDFVTASRAELRVASSSGTELRDVHIESHARVRAANEPGAWILTGGVRAPIAAVVRARGHHAREVQIPAGSNELEIVLDPCDGFELAIELVSAAGRDDTQLDIELQRDDAPLETRTLRIDRSPGGRAEVTFDDVPPGVYTLTPRDDGPWAFDPPQLRVEVPGAAARFIRRDSQQPAQIFVRARDASGRAIESARCALLVDRYDLGRRAAIEAQRTIPNCEVAPNGATGLAVLPGQRFWWLVEADGFTSVHGDEHDARRSGDRVELDVRLDPSWHCELWIGARTEAGSIDALAGVRVATIAGRELATSLPDGRIVLDLPYDPGQLRIESAGRRVVAWEGFTNGRRRAALPVHRVLLEHDR